MAPPPTQSAYLKYKRDTSQLIHWIIQTSNNLPSASTSPIVKSEITVATLLLLSKIIASRIKPIPSTIFSIFESVIAARRSAYSFYQQIVHTDPDRKIVESNERHKAFLDALVDAYEAFGGSEWEKRKEEALRSGKSVDEIEEEATSVNRFEGLEVAAVAEDSGEDDDDDADENTAPTAGQRNKAKGKGKGKGKGKKGKGKAKGGKTVAREPKPIPKEHPLESYKLIDGEEGAVDRLMAVYCFLKDFMELRNYTQEVWRKVAARKYNCAAAGAITNVCIARIKQLEFEIDTDFPGYGSFDAIVNTFLHGKDPDKLRSMMSVGLYKVGDNNSFEPAIELKALDIKECVLINAYRDITAFLTDYRKNRSGKPTKAMMQRTRGWDPLLNLSTVSEEERLQWRSVYAIKWLYDLVNTYAFPALSMVMSGELEKSKLENMNWGEDNEWGGRTMWGPVEFAADLTGFSMKTSARLPAVILPHHVFTMQAALDSMTASRGWTHNPLTGPVVVPAPVKMWSNHSAHAEIDEVIENEDRGFRTGANLYIAILQRDIIDNDDPDRHEFLLENIPEFLDQLDTTLGYTMISQKTPELPPSQFSDTDPNGLWNYNPFLCGTGLAEALSFLFRYGMTAWDKALVPLSILHLYNMLRDTKSVEPIPLYETLTHVFGKSVFADGKPPKRNFYTSLAASIRAKPKPRSALANKDRVLRGSTHFTDLSVLSMLEEADWIPDRIADEGLPIYSGMGFCRLNNSKPTKDGAEAKPELEDTSFLKMLKASSAYTPELETGFAAAMARDEGYTSRLHPATVGEETESLEFVLMDIRENIEGTSYHGYERITGRQLRLPSRNRDSIPPSGVNYLRLLATMMLAYMVMEKAVDDMEVVKEWKTHLKPGVKMDSASRVTGVAMQTMDEELLKRLGKELKAVTLGVDLSAFMYWSQLEVPSHSTWDRRPT